MTQKRGGIVVVTENLPRFNDGALDRAVRTMFGTDHLGTEIVSVTDLKHLLRTKGVLQSVLEHIRTIERRDGLDGILVITEGGSHRPAVRTLRREGGYPSRLVKGLTTRRAGRANLVAVAPTDRTLFAEGGLSEAIARTYNANPTSVFLTVPGGAGTLTRDRTWFRFLRDGLIHLYQRQRMHRVLLIDRSRVARVPTGDIIAVREHLKDALPGIDILIADSDRSRTRGVTLEPVRLTATS